MNTQKEAIKTWPDDKVREYLDQQNPNEKTKWTVLDESLYGYIDPAGTIYAYADDDELRNAGVIQFLIRNGGTYISNA